MDRIKELQARGELAEVIVDALTKGLTMADLERLLDGLKRFTTFKPRKKLRGKDDKA